MARKSKQPAQEFILLQNGMCMDKDRFEEIERQFAELHKKFL